MAGLPQAWNWLSSRAHCTCRHRSGAHYRPASIYRLGYVERDTDRVKCRGQEHNTSSTARARARTARLGVECTNHEATSEKKPPKCYHPSKIDTSCFLTNMFSNLRSLWMYPCLCIYSSPLTMSFAHRIVVLSVEDVEDGTLAGIFLGFRKMCLFKFSLQSSITIIALSCSPSFSSDEPKNFTMNGWFNFLRKAKGNGGFHSNPGKIFFSCIDTEIIPEVSHTMIVFHRTYNGFVQEKRNCWTDCFQMNRGVSF